MGKNTAEQSRRHQKEKRDWAHEQKNVPCMDCGVQYPSYVMQFDHREPSEKEAPIWYLAASSWKKLKAEIEKCDVVCANCHAERTHQQRLALQSDS